jgi:ABC-type bacteriocin/lantibiotic exporter with double-glycine peptidase domain
MMRVNSNAQIREMLTQHACWFADGPLAVYLVILFMASPALGALVVLLGMLQAGVFLPSYRRYQDLTSQDLQTQATAQSYLVHMLAGIETLKASGLEDRAVEQWSHLFVDELNVALKRGRLSALVEALMSTLRMGSPIFVLWFGGLQALHGSLSVGTMLALSALASGVLSPIATLISTALQLQMLRSYIERLEDVRRLPQNKPSATYPAPHACPARSHWTGLVQLRAARPRGGARFPCRLLQGKKWPSSAARCWQIDPRQIAAGSHPPISGRILYDGLDLAGLDLQSVRQQCGIVPQRSYLFGQPSQEYHPPGPEYYDATGG